MQRHKAILGLIAHYNLILNNPDSPLKNLHTFIEEERYSCSQHLRNNGVRYNSTDNGKCICVSFPAHELNLIEELDDLANQEFITRSQYIRRMIRREAERIGIMTTLRRQVMAGINYGERTLQDHAQWSKLGGIYYEQHPTDKTKDCRVHFNALAGTSKTLPPTTHGTPPPEMKAWHDGISRALTTMQPATSRGFY